MSNGTKLYFNYTTGSFHFKNERANLNSSELNSILTLFKETYHLFYDSTFYDWKTKSAITAKTVFNDLQAYGGCFASQEDLDLLDDFIYPLDNEELKKVKLPVNASVIEKFPPLKGKPGYENFQLEAIKSGITQNRIIYNIEMGLGKSYIVSVVLATLYNLSKIDKIFIVARDEGVENLRLELLRFAGEFFNEDDIGVVTTDHREIENHFDKKIIITNYITFRLTGQYYNKKRFKSEAKRPRKQAIKFNTWGEHRMIILDECQELNHYNSQQSHMLHLYADCFERRIIMSGSIGYEVLHYYSLCKFLVPKMIPYSFSEWTSYIAKKGTYYSEYAIKELREKEVAEFKSKVIDKLQVTYSHCLELPEHKKEITYLRMTDKMLEIYKAFFEYQIKLIQEQKENEVDGKSLYNKFIYLTQITSDPSLVLDKIDQKFTWDFEKDSPKIPVIKSLLEKYIDIENRKVILWGSHPKILNKLVDILTKYKPYVIHGNEEETVKKVDRFTEVENFKKDKSRNLLIASYVLSTSLNITQATRQIYFDVPLNADDYEQSAKRIHRGGQTEPVITNQLLYDRSIDIYVYNEVLMKKGIRKNVLSSKKELTTEDFKKVFVAKATDYFEKAKEESKKE